jgi:hypothetical protein
MTRVARILCMAATVAALLGACASPPTDPSASGPTPTASPTASQAPADGRTGIGGRATAGPVCPVETNPPDPACAPRPVAGALIVIRPAAGAQISRVTTGVDGTFLAALPAGAYTVEPQPAGGLMGTPEPQQVTVVDGAVTSIELGYDTGIR